MNSIFFIISIILNIILVIFLFFKTALNDILKEWCLDKRKDKREARERLINLRTSLVKLSALSPLLIVLLPAHFGKETQSQWEGALKEFTKESEDITKDEILFPNDIRILLKEFHERFGKAIVEVSTNFMYKTGLIGEDSALQLSNQAVATDLTKRLKELSHEISSSVLQIIERVEHELQKILQRKKKSSLKIK